MKFIATHDAIIKLNQYCMTEMDVTKEFQSYRDVETGKSDVGKMVMNWKNEDLIIAPIGRKTALIMVYGEELNQSYEELPEIEYKENEWKVKVISES